MLAIQIVNSIALAESVPDTGNHEQHQGGGSEHPCDITSL